MKAITTRKLADQEGCKQAEWTYLVIWGGKVPLPQVVAREAIRCSQGQGLDSQAIPDHWKPAFLKGFHRRTRTLREKNRQDRKKAVQAQRRVDLFGHDA